MRRYLNATVCSSLANARFFAPDKPYPYQASPTKRNERSIPPSVSVPDAAAVDGKFHMVGEAFSAHCIWIVS